MLTCVNNTVPYSLIQYSTVSIHDISVKFREITNPNKSKEEVDVLQK